MLRTGAGPSARGLIGEVQRARDPGKAWAWPPHRANLRARHRHGSRLLVITLSALDAQLDVFAEAAPTSEGWDAALRLARTAPDAPSARAALTARAG